jgi:uncharacterized protein
MSDAAAGPATPIRRVAKGERIVNLDVLRGIAILAILIMNIPFMAGYVVVQPLDPRLVSWTALDQGVYRAIGTFLDGTQRGLLELLFGAGVMIMARGAMTPDAPVAIADLHYRRNLLLMAFGAFQALVLLWPGDILFPYGLVAVLIFGFRNLKPRTKAVVGMAFILLAIAPGAFRYFERADQQAQAQALIAKEAAKTPLTADEAEQLKDWRKIESGLALPAQSQEKREMMAEERGYRTGPFVEYVGFTWVAWTKVNFSPHSWFWLSEIAGTMLLGMALFQWGVIQGRRSAAFYLALTVAGYGVGATLRTLAIDEAIRFRPDPQVGWITWDIARLALTLGHVGLVNLVLKSSMGARLLSPFQASGRMPLTIYLSASFIGMWILFSPFGFGLWGRYGWAGMEAIALAVMAGQLVFANVWLRYFESGPVDWVWKSLAYRKAQPWRRAAAPGAAPAAAPAE